MSEDRTPPPTLAGVATSELETVGAGKDANFNTDVAGGGDDADTLLRPHTDLPRDIQTTDDGDAAAAKKGTGSDDSDDDEGVCGGRDGDGQLERSEEHTSELQSHV